MKEFFKTKFITLLVVSATIILTFVAVFTAWKLYQTTKLSPEESLGQEGVPIYSCTTITFSISTNQPTPTTPIEPTRPIPTPTPTPLAQRNTPTPTPLAQRNTPTPTPSIRTTTPTPTPTPASLPQAGIISPTLSALGLGILVIATSLALLIF